jgi:hypothetical protein
MTISKNAERILNGLLLEKPTCADGSHAIQRDKLPKTCHPRHVAHYCYLKNLSMYWSDSYFYIRSLT